jgi:hypothetical protein
MENLHAAAFASEPELVHNAQTVQKPDSSFRKTGRAAAGGGKGELQNKIRASGQCHLRPRVFIENGRGSSLYKVTAHDDKKKISAGETAYFLQHIGVSAVERIVFCDYRRCPHKASFMDCQFRNIVKYLFSTPVFEVLRAPHFGRSEALCTLPSLKIDENRLSQASFFRLFASIFRGAEQLRKLYQL